jgi:hypothetical protein
VASAGSPWAEARVGQPWPGLGRSVGTARRPSGAAERPTLHSANHRSALPVAASASSGGTGAGWMWLHASHPLHRITALHCLGLSPHDRIALSHVRWMSAAWAWAAAAASRLLFAQSMAGCVPDAPADSTARLSTVTPPRAAPPGLSFPACASPS